MTLNVALEILSLIVLILCMLVLLMGAMYFEEWEAGIEFMPKGYNNFELGVSNRNHVLVDGGQEQELRIGFLIFTLFVVFRRFDA